MKTLSKDHVIEIINAELSYSGKTYDDVKSDSEWYYNNTMTAQQHDEWIAWVGRYLSENLKWPKWLIKKNVAWIDLMWGLRVAE